MAKEKFGYAESTALAATYGGAQLFSVVDKTAVLENGMLVALDDMDSDGVYTIKTPEQGDKVVLVLNEAVIYDQCTTMAQAEIYYSIAAGEPARAYGLIEEDRLKIADYMVTTLAGAGKSAVQGNFLVVDGARKYKEIAATEDISAYGFVAKIADIEYKSGLTLYLIRLVKNEKVGGTK